MKAANSSYFRSVIGIAILAQAADRSGGARWFMIGGALTVLAMGVAMVLLVRSRRRDEYERRVAMRVDATAAPETPATPEPEAVRSKRRSTATFIDLSADPNPVPQPTPTPTASAGRTSPMSSYDPDAASPKRETFVDLPGTERDPIIDLTDDSVDLTEEREEAGPARDPWS